MAFNPIETSLYATFSTLTQDQAILPKIADNPNLTIRTLDFSFFQNDAYLKNTILSFTAPPSALEPYQQIIYNFSKRLETQFLTSSTSAIDIVHDALEMKPMSDTMVGLKKEQMSFLVYIGDLIDYCTNRSDIQNPHKMQEWRQKNILIREIFAASKPAITSDEYSEIYDLAKAADQIKNRFTRVNSLYLPT